MTHTRSGMRRARLAVGLGCALLLSTALAQAPVSAPGAVEQRVARLERLAESQGLLRMLKRLDTLEAELRGLRGDIELQSHSITQLKQRQRELYLDVDRRLQQVERATPPAAAAGAAPVAGSAPLAAAGAPSTPPAAVPPPAPMVPAASAAQPPPASSAPAIATAQPSTAAQIVAPAAASTAATGQPNAGQTLSASAPAQPQPAIDPAAEQRAYQGAFDLLKGGRYEKAAKSLAEFLQNFPNGAYADNAQYWLGEAYYVTRQFDLALTEFQKLATTFPKSPKLTHALLKIGYINDELGHRDEAARVLRDLIARYPKTTAANLAQKRLKQLGAR